MTLNVVTADELQAVIKQTVEATVLEVLQQINSKKAIKLKDDMNTEELLDYLAQNSVHLSKQTIHGRTCAGTIPFYKVGGKLLFKRTEIDAWIESYCNKGKCANKADKKGIVEALADSATEHIKRS